MGPTALNKILQINIALKMLRGIARDIAGLQYHS